MKNMNEIKVEGEVVEMLNFEGIKIEKNKKRGKEWGGKYGSYVLGKGVCGELVRGMVKNLILGVDIKKGMDFGKVSEKVGYDLCSRSRGIGRDMVGGKWEGKKVGESLFIRWKGDNDWIEL